MVDVEKRYNLKPWVTHDETKMIKQRFYDTQLPPLKATGDQRVTAKYRSPRHPKRDGTHFLPAIARDSSSEFISNSGNLTSSTNHSETSPIAYSSAVHEAAKRFILRNNMARFSQEFSSIHFSNTLNPKRKSLYNHVQAKIDTGLPRINNANANESNTYQLEPKRTVNWSALRSAIEQDINIRAHANRMEYNAGNTCKAQSSLLANLARSKVKAHLASATGSGDERYKVVVHLTVYSTTVAGLHVASRCLWDTNTDNSITVRMQGIDCDILMVIFLCYTDVGGM